MDIDGDGDLDAFIGGYDGKTIFFKNNTPSAPEIDVEVIPTMSQWGIGILALILTIFGVQGVKERHREVGKVSGSL